MGMCGGMCIGMCVDMSIGMCIGIWIDMCIGMCIDIYARHIFTNRDEILSTASLNPATPCRTHRGTIVESSVGSSHGSAEIGRQAGGQCV